MEEYIDLLNVGIKITSEIIVQTFREDNLI